MTSGINTLTDIELLAIFLRTAYKSDVLTLSATLLSKFGGICGIANATQNDLMDVKGIGAVKSIELIALFEFAKRNVPLEKEFIRSDKEAVMIAHSLIEDFTKESFLLILLDFQNKLIYKTILYSGTKHEVLVDPKDILSQALKHNAASIYCFHNHPSGNLTPSRADVSITKRIAHYCDLFGVGLKGHIIISENKNYFPIGI